MANAFKNKLSRDIGTALTAIGGYTVPASTETTCIGLTVSNTSSSQITVDVTINDGSNDTYLVDGAPVPVGSALVAVGDLQKVVLETGHSMKVKSSASASCDAVMSILEIT